jgi:hypothetical protein
MALSEQQLKDFLTQNNLPHESLHLLWEIRDQIVYGIFVGGVEAIEQWTNLRQGLDVVGYYPLLLGGEDEISCYIDTIEELQDDRYNFMSMEELKNEVTNFDSDQWLAERAQMMYTDRREYQELDDGDPTEVLCQDIFGKWRENVSPSHNFMIPYNHQYQPLDRIVVALIPNQTCWLMPAFLNFGGWNDCPDLMGHLIMMKRWYEQYGAEVVGITHDVVEMRVAKPPLDQTQAIALAKEQYLYCSDIVEQGTETLCRLAGLLVQGTAWYFWWD